MTPCTTFMNAIMGHECPQCSSYSPFNLKTFISLNSSSLSTLFYSALLCYGAVRTARSILLIVTQLSNCLTIPSNHLFIKRRTWDHRYVSSWMYAVLSIKTWPWTLRRRLQCPSSSFRLSSCVRSLFIIIDGISNYQWVLKAYDLVYKFQLAISSG